VAPAPFAEVSGVYRMPSPALEVLALLWPDYPERRTWRVPKRYLEHFSGLSPESLDRELAALEERGLVETEEERVATGLFDRRTHVRTVVTLTEAGRRQPELVELLEERGRGPTRRPLRATLKACAGLFRRSAEPPDRDPGTDEQPEEGRGFNRRRPW
jgi:DNA-binding PadR family transcriptional regulator